MKIEFWQIGKTERGWVEDGCQIYAARVKRYAPFEQVLLPDVREKGEPDFLKKREGEAVLKKLTEGDLLVLLDENGSEFGSVEFAGWLEKRLASGKKRLVFLVGGAFGFSAEVRARADFQVSLSRLTFPHQLVRIMFLEQLYRAFSILGNEPYHNQ